MQFFKKFNLVFLLCGFCWGACAERSRDNPLDPLNKNTQGKLASPILLAQDKSVKVSWQALEVDRLKEYNVYRQLADERDFQKIARVSHLSNYFWDLDVPVDTLLSYKISASFETFESLHSDVSQIRPGPSSLWAIDSGLEQVLKFRHDTRATEFKRIMLYRPVALRLVKAGLFAWILFENHNDILKLGRNGEYLAFVTLPQRALSIELDKTDQSFWAINTGAKSVTLYDSSGVELFSFAGFGYLQSLAINQNDQSLWVLDRGNGTISSFSRNGLLKLSLGGFENGKQIAFDSAREILWVADSTEVKNWRPGVGITTVISGLENAHKLALNDRDGDCWVLSSSPQIGESRLLNISEGGAINTNASGFAKPVAIAVNPFNGNCFVSDTRSTRGFLKEINRLGDVVGERETGGILISMTVEFMEK